jgi:predicted amidophosphoribosyltransferase
MDGPEPISVGLDPNGGPSDGGTAGDDAFLWPPLALADEPILDDTPETESDGRPPTPAGVGLLGQLEEDLLGVRSMSFARWAARTGWSPDGFGAFCWRCAESVGPHEVSGDGCGSCRERRLAWDRAIRLSVYAGGPRAAVTELKFGRWRRTGIDLGRAMGARLRDTMDTGGFGPKEVVLMPVPTSWRRRMARGVDHARVLACAAGAEAGVRVVAGLARRHTPPQVGLSATARAANIRGAFRAREGLSRRVDGVRAVIVIDDVRTTGATMTVACRAVRSVIGPKREIWSLVATVASTRRAREEG